MSREKTYRKAKVWNRHSEDFDQKVKGEIVHIPAGKSITVSRREALNIRGHYPGKDIVTKIEIEPIMEEIDVPDEYIDHKTGQTFNSKKELLQHLGVDPALGVDPDGFECVICGESFGTKDELVTHLKTCVAQSAQKPKTKAEATAKK